VYQEKLTDALFSFIRLNPAKILKQYGVDQTRFFLMSEVNFGNDGDFSDKAMITKHQFGQ